MNSEFFSGSSGRGTSQPHNDVCDAVANGEVSTRGGDT
jgi:hypothetical protein